jgi:hypothetical protein
MPSKFFRELPVCSGTSKNLNKQNLKPGFHCIGSRVEARRFQAMGPPLRLLSLRVTRKAGTGKARQTRSGKRIQLVQPHPSRRWGGRTRRRWGRRSRCPCSPPCRPARNRRCFSSHLPTPRAPPPTNFRHLPLPLHLPRRRRLHLHFCVTCHHPRCSGLYKLSLKAKALKPGNRFLHRLMNG